MITEQQLIEICPTMVGRANFWLDSLNEAMSDAKINTRLRKAAFIAQCAHESGQFKILEEGLNYSAEGLVKTFKFFRNNPSKAEEYARQPERIANLVYANREGNGDEASGDGYKYRGHGIFQITFRNNFRACSLAICKDENTLLDHPELLSDPDYASYAAAWYWVENDLNTWADKPDFDAVCDIINLGRRSPAIGDSNGYADRNLYYQRGLRIL